MVYTHNGNYLLMGDDAGTLKIFKRNLQVGVSSCSSFRTRGAMPLVPLAHLACAALLPGGA
jgi:hypothetical protein